MTFSMTDFMFSSTYLTQVLGRCSSEAEATHVAYHARQMLSEMESKPSLKEAFLGGYDTIECYKENSIAWQVAVDNCEAIDARLERGGHRRIYANHWPAQCERLVREYLEAEQYLHAEINEDLFVVTSIHDSDNEF